MDKAGNQLFQKNTRLPWVELRCASNSSACYAIHTHDEFSFGVIDQGCSVYRNRNRHYRVGRGDTVFINPGDPHACNPERTTWSYRMLFVDAHWLGQLQAEFCTFQSGDYLPFACDWAAEPARFQHFEHLFAALHADCEPLEAETRLIGYLADCFGGKKAFSAPGTRVQRVREMLEDQPAQQVGLSELARLAGLSRYQLIRDFKKAYGLPPHAYQLDTRIRRAKNWLQQGESLSSTAVALGFADQSHFQRHFKKRVAVTPKQYQACFR